MELAYPASATEFTVTTIVMKTDQEWYGWVQTVVPGSPPPGDLPKRHAALRREFG